GYSPCTSTFGTSPTVCCNNASEACRNGICISGAEICPAGTSYCRGSQGEVICCDAHLTCCDGACVNLAEDPNNCGRCGNSCGSHPSAACSSYFGRCICSSGDACSGSKGFTCCQSALGETCCDGVCCAAGNHCQGSICATGCV